MDHVKLFILKALIATCAPISAAEFTTESGKGAAFDRLDSSTYYSSSQRTVASNNFITERMDAISTDNTRSNYLTTAEIFPSLTETFIIGIPLTDYDSTRVKRPVASTSIPKTIDQKTPSSIESISLLNEPTTEKLQPVTLQETTVTLKETKGLSPTESFPSVADNQTMASSTTFQANEKAVTQDHTTLPTTTPEFTSKVSKSVSEEPTRFNNNETLDPTEFTPTGSSEVLNKSKNSEETTGVLKNIFQTTTEVIGNTEETLQSITVAGTEETSRPTYTDKEITEDSNIGLFSKTEAKTVHGSTVETNFAFEVANQTAVPNSEPRTLDVDEAINPTTLTQITTVSNKVTEDETMVTLTKEQSSTKLISLQTKTLESFSTNMMHPSTKLSNTNDSTKYATETFSETVSSRPSKYTTTAPNFTGVQILDTSGTATPFAINSISNVIERTTVQTSKIQPVATVDISQTTAQIQDVKAISTHVTNDVETAPFMNTTPQTNPSVYDATRLSFSRLSSVPSRIEEMQTEKPTTKLANSTKFTIDGTIDPTATYPSAAFTQTSSSGGQSQTEISAKTTKFLKNSFQTTNTNEILSISQTRIQSSTVSPTNLIGNTYDTRKPATGPTPEKKFTSELPVSGSTKKSVVSSKTEAETAYTISTTKTDYTFGMENETAVPKSEPWTLGVDEPFTPTSAEVVTATDIPTESTMLSSISQLATTLSNEFTENITLITSTKEPLLTRYIRPPNNTMETFSTNKVNGSAKRININSATLQTKDITENFTEAVSISPSESTTTGFSFTATQILDTREVATSFAVSSVLTVSEGMTVEAETDQSKVQTVSAESTFRATARTEDVVTMSAYATNQQTTTTFVNTTSQQNELGYAATMTSFPRSTSISSVEQFTTDSTLRTSSFSEETKVPKLPTEYTTRGFLTPTEIHTTQGPSVTFSPDILVSESTASILTSSPLQSSSVTDSKSLLASVDSIVKSVESTTSKLLTKPVVTETLMSFATTFTPKTTTFKDITTLPTSLSQKTIVVEATTPFLPITPPVTTTDQTTTQPNEETTNIQTTSPKAAQTSTLMKVLSNVPDTTSVSSISPTITLLIKASAITFTRNQEETQSNPKTESPEMSQGLSSGVIAAIVIACLILVIALACLIASRQRKRTGSLNFPLYFKKGDKVENSSSRNMYTSF